MLEVCKCMRAYSMHESQSKEIRPYVPERQTVHADYMPAEFLFHQKSPHNRDNKIYIHVGKSTLHMQETLYFLIKLLNRCYATSRHNIFILWRFAASLCITTSLFYHSPTFTKKKTAIKEEKSFIRAVGSRGYIALGCCWPECLTLGYCPAVRSLQLCLGSQSWILPLRFECLSTPFSKVLTATIY